MDLPAEAFSSVAIIALAIVFQAASGIPLLITRASPAGQKAAAGCMVAGCLIGIAGAVHALLNGVTEAYYLSWELPFGAAEVGIDPLSSFFIIPVCLVFGCAAIYQLGYWPARRNPHNVARMTFFLGLLAAALTALLLARDSVSFLMAWEVMALCAYFALTTQDEKREVREAGILYLITTHFATLALFAFFSLLCAQTASFAFPQQGTLLAHGALAAALFATAFLGFGLKAGVMPLHVWLPSAHASAPTHVSAILSGVVLKMGIYGLLRAFSFFGAPPIWWGSAVLVIGSVSAIVGVAFAIGQHDLKRLLAYHSIENVGIIVMGIGLALIGKTAGNSVLMGLGLAGALLHTLNHATFKALLFFAAGSVIHATGTREMELMGGVARRLPKTSILFLVGAVAISGLPPLNGFVSELLLYLGSFSAMRSLDGVAAALPGLAAPALALVGALAAACFVKVFGTVFLGAARAPQHAGGHEAPATMLFPMAVLAAVCAVTGLLPGLFSVPLQSALRSFTPFLATVILEQSVPFSLVSIIAAVLLVLALLVGVLLKRTSAGAPVSGTWGCGYLRPAPSMQYTPASFAAMLVDWFRGVLRPEAHEPEIRELFPGRAHFASHLPETVLERVYLPVLAFLYEKSSAVRRLQHGHINLYIGYSFVTLVVLLVVTMR